VSLASIEQVRDNLEAGRTLMLSVLIPAHNEVDCIAGTVEALYAQLCDSRVPHEIVVVDDHSADDTARVVSALTSRVPTLRLIHNPDSGGFGYAIRAGLESFKGDAVCLVMADASDDPRDVVSYYRKLEEGFECVFGSRFIKGGGVVDYPRHKLALNRLANLFIRSLFGFRYNDTTNAFKCYRRSVLEGVAPLFSCHFNITVELPLKAITRGYSYTVVPTRWYNRATGVSKLKVKEMGSRYLFIVLYVFLEKLLSRGDYRRSPESPSSLAYPTVASTELPQ
jgi:dolichol-phosphate mannosyltransferase